MLLLACRGRRRLHLAPLCTQGRRLSRTRRRRPWRSLGCPRPGRRHRSRCRRRCRWAPRLRAAAGLLGTSTWGRAQGPVGRGGGGWAGRKKRGQGRSWRQERNASGRIAVAPGTRACPPAAPGQGREARKAGGRRARRRTALHSSAQLQRGDAAKARADAIDGGHDGGGAPRGTVAGACRRARVRPRQRDGERWEAARNVIGPLAGGRTQRGSCAGRELGEDGAHSCVGQGRRL
jgi:hypothetical protein